MKQGLFATGGSPLSKHSQQTAPKILEPLIGLRSLEVTAYTQPPAISIRPCGAKSTGPDPLLSEAGVKQNREKQRNSCRLQVVVSGEAVPEAGGGSDVPAEEE